MSLIKNSNIFMVNIRKTLNNWSYTKKLVSSAILAIFTSILHASGSLFPGIGLLMSPLSTFTILFSTFFSLQHGFLTYFATIILLFIIEPSELFIFPFATGLLGLGLGWGFIKLKNRWITISIVNGLLLFMGICFPLYVLHFPILGPTILSVPKLSILFAILVFSLIYSLLWLWVSIALIKYINKYFPEKFKSQ